MATLSPGFFRGRSREAEPKLPPGQYLTHDFPVLSAGPTPKIPTERYEFTIGTETGEKHSWSWDELLKLPAETRRWTSTA